MIEFIVGFVMGVVSWLAHNFNLEDENDRY